MQGRRWHMEPNAAFCRPALRGIRQQQAVMAAHATIQIAQKRALLHHAFQSQSSAAQAALIQRARHRRCENK